MAITSYPFDNQDTTESQFSKLFRELQDSGVIDSQGGTALQPFADSTGMTVKLRAGAAIVRGFVMNSDAVYTITLPASETQARIDRIVLRLDPTANSITPTYIKGTAGSGVAPAMTQTDTDVYDLPIATVNVAASAPNIGPTNVTDVRPFVGSRIGSWATATRPTAPRTNQLGYNSTTGLWETWSGAAWGAPVNELTAAISPNRKLSYFWGAGTAFPTVGVLAGDTFRRTDWFSSFTYDGTSWYQDAVGSCTVAQRTAMVTTGLPAGFTIWDSDGLKRKWEWTGSTWSLVGGPKPFLLGYANGQTVNGVTEITAYTKIVDTDSAMTGGRFVAPFAGYWRVSGAVSFAPPAAGGPLLRDAWLVTNGRDKLDTHINISAYPVGANPVVGSANISVYGYGNTVNTSLPLPSRRLLLQAGEWVSVFAYTGTVSNLTNTAEQDQISFLEVTFDGSV